MFHRGWELLVCTYIYVYTIFKPSVIQTRSAEYKCLFRLYKKLRRGFTLKMSVQGFGIVEFRFNIIV